MHKYHWPLAVDPFSYFDRLKACSFYLNKKNILTMGPKVSEFEARMSTYSDGSYALAVSSGSAANFVIFELYKQLYPEKFKNSLVIVPTVTWISSISPILHAGYEIQFCDINLGDFSFNYEQLEVILNDNKHKNIIIWPTALIGYCPSLNRLKQLALKYGAELWGDFCENQMSTYNGKSILGEVDMCSLSMYWSHQCTSVELGFVFFKDYDKYLHAKMLRNHGLTRSLAPGNSIRQSYEIKNPNIDPQFLFANLGTNVRPTDCHAIWGLIDFKRVEEYKQHRKNIYEYFKKSLDNTKYFLPKNNIDSKAEHVAFCLPIINKYVKSNILKSRLNAEGIETRPIIGGNLLIQPCFERYKKSLIRYGGNPNSEYLNNYGCYVGLHKNLQYKDIDDLVKILNYY